MFIERLVIVRLNSGLILIISIVIFICWRFAKPLVQIKYNDRTSLQDNILTMICAIGSVAGILFLGFGIFFISDATSLLNVEYAAAMDLKNLLK